MKILNANTKGISKAVPSKFTSKLGSEFYAFVHGQEGRGRWQVRISLVGGATPETENFSLQENKILDPKGNKCYSVKPSLTEDGEFLILLDLEPGYRKFTSCGKMSDNFKVIAQGTEADGIAGRVGGGECPIVHVKGDGCLKWTREGRIYGSDATWLLICFEGNVFTISVKKLLTELEMYPDNFQEMVAPFLE